MKPGYIRIGLVFLLIIWCTGFAMPLFVNQGYAAFSGLLLSNFYSTVCHQVTEKSFSAGSVNFLVCARCTGIYTGALLMSLLLLFIRSVRAVYIIPAAILLALDVFLVNAGIYSYSKIIAFGTGLLLGLSLFPYILTALEKSFSLNEIK